MIILFQEYSYTDEQRSYKKNIKTSKKTTNSPKKQPKLTFV